MSTKEKYRIENVQTARYNNRPVKIFSAYEYNENQNAYIFIGKFTAPKMTTNKNLSNFIN